MAATFSTSTGSVTLSRDAELGNGETWGRVQARGRTQDGQFMAADKGIQVRQFQLSFRELTDDDKANLEAFVNDHAVGSTVEVTYADRYGGRWIVKFIDERLQWVEQWDAGAGRHEVTVELEVVREVTTS